MAQEHYRLDHDTARRFLRLKLIGVWDEAVVAALIREVTALLNRINRSGPAVANGRLLIDLTDYPVQPKSITDQLAALLPAFGTLASRVAVVRSASALQNMQADRLLAGGKAHFFASGAEAIAWLQRPEGVD